MSLRHREYLEGRRMMLYRGISHRAEGRHPSSHLGIFASPNLRTAKAYAGSKGEVVALYMKIKNPYLMEYEEIQRIGSKSDAVRLRSKLKQKGHDGILLKPIKGSGGMPNAYTEYIVFDKSQIERAD